MTQTLLVRDLMTSEVTTLKRNDSLLIADDILRLGRIRHLPVISDDDGKVVGVLSQRDLLHGALARAVGYGEFAQAKLKKMMLVKEVMTVDPETIAPDASLAEAADRMLKHKLGCLPVVEDGKLVGILTESDFVRHVARRE